MKVQRFSNYQDNPVEFCTKVLGANLTQDMKRMLISVHENPVTIVQSANATGKTFSAAHIAIWFYKVFQNSQVYTTAAPPFDNLRRLLWGEIGKIVENRKSIFMDDKITRMNISNGAMNFITGVAIPTSGNPSERESKFSGKHAPNLMFIVDEGDAVPNEIYSGIESCLSGGNSKLLIMFNPRHQAGAVYQKIENKSASVISVSAFNHPNVITGKDLIPGAVTQNITVRRINEWTRPIIDGELIDSETFVVPSYLIGSTAIAQDGSIYPPLDAGIRKVVRPEFSYMVMGTYPAQSDFQLISDSWIARARERWDNYVITYGEKQNNPIMGLDVAEYGKDYNVAVFRDNNFISRFYMWSGMDVIATGDYALSLFLKHKAQLIIVDSTGVGGGVAPYMSKKKQVKAVSVKVGNKPLIGFVRAENGDFFQFRDQLWWAVREWLRTEEAMLPPDEFLIQELKAMTYAVQNGKIKIVDKKILRDILRRSPDRSDALCMTFAPQRRAKVLDIGDNYGGY